MENIVSVVKGVSASGKSSRVYQLISFFENELGMKKEPFFFTNIEGKRKEVGIFFEEPNILFIGQEYNSGGVTRFQGFDNKTSCFKGTALFCDFLKEQAKKSSVVIEGAGITQSNRYRPLFMRKDLGIKNIYIQYYNFKNEEKDEYDQRIMLRSGKLPPKGTMWDKCSSFNKEYQFSLNEKESLENNETIYVNWDHYTTPIDDYGTKMLVLMGLDFLVERFISYTESFDYIAKNRFENFQ